MYLTVATVTVTVVYSFMNVEYYFCKFRVSAHILVIAKGRYSVPKIQPEDKICKFCNLNEVEDEFHFVKPMRCQLYNTHRETPFRLLVFLWYWQFFSEDDLFINIMSVNEYVVVTWYTWYVQCLYYPLYSSLISDRVCKTRYAWLMSFLLI